jgi:phage baseplate assembly protein W
MLNIAYPFTFDARGRTAEVSRAEHVLELIKMLCLTHPGERVNRPDLGGGARALVFSPNSAELAATVRFTLQSNLQRWLGDVIELSELDVAAEESTLQIAVRYIVRRTREAVNVQFTHQV